MAGPEEAAVATFLFAVGVQDDVGAATFGADGAWVHGGEFFIGWCKAKERMVGVWAHGSDANIVYIARIRVGRALFFVGAWGGGTGWRK